MRDLLVRKQELFEGKALFNKLWLSFDKRAELDMRSTVVVSYLFAFVPGNLFEEPSAKMARTSVTICDMNFTSTGNGLVVIDSLGQLYVYRMSPISDPGKLSLCYETIS